MFLIAVDYFKCLSSLAFFICHIVDVVIGFHPVTYSVIEGGIVNFEVRILSSTLTKDIEVEFFTSDGDAAGNYILVYFM